ARDVDAGEDVRRVRAGHARRAGNPRMLQPGARFEPERRERWATPVRGDAAGSGGIAASQRSRDGGWSEEMAAVERDEQPTADGGGAGVQDVAGRPHARRAQIDLQSEARQL